MGKLMIGLLIFSLIVCLITVIILNSLKLEFNIDINVPLPPPLQPENIDINVSYTMMELGNKLADDGDNNNLKNAINGVFIMLSGLIVFSIAKILWNMKVVLVSQILKFVAVCLLIAGSITTLSQMSDVLSLINLSYLTNQNNLITNFNINVGLMYITSILSLLLVVLFIVYKLASPALLTKLRLK